ncbi:MAG: peptidoglycan-binding protein, partial [Clostridia bacterium]|nr:peptidoglycan-binding protein [Clostridia bacterium]
QQRLKDLGYYTGSVDGDFGNGTETAVKEFQKANGLSVDGKAGKNTLNKLYSDSAISKRSYEASQKTATPKPTTKATKKPTATATPNLSKDYYLEVGSSGSKVRTLQNRLIELGWLAGQADGEFGGATEYALKAFQAREGLWNDGVAGPDTLEELYSNKAAKTSTVQSSVGVTLKSGMEGASVRALQKRLKSLGYYDGSVDGSYGAETIAAVKTFQAHNGLSDDGRAGTSTLNKIYSDSANKYSSAGSAAGSGTVSSTGYITLREGDDSDAVRKLQRKLKDLGYYTGSVDGDYGSATTNAVKVFQQMNDLRVDGIAGPQTQRVLYGTSASISYSALTEGDEGSAVTNLQYTLYELGYYDGSIDGIYGQTTKDAVRAFQIRNDLSVDGKAGSQTLKRMYSSSAVPAQASYDYVTLEKGDRGEAVISLQQVLKNLGYLSEKTGLYDNATVEAVKSFQRYNGLSVDGKAGAETQAKLYSDSAVAYPGP